MNKLVIHEFGKLKLDENGIWYHDDAPFVHEGMSKVFHQNLIKENNTYYVKLDKSKVPVEIEDVALWVDDLDIFIPQSKLILHLSNGQEHIVEQQTELTLENETKLYCYINGEKVKFTKKSFNFVAQYLNENSSGYYLQIGNLSLPINIQNHI